MKQTAQAAKGNQTLDQLTGIAPQLPLDIVVVLDRSGSMQSIREDSTGAYNSFIAEQQAQPGEANITLAIFDHEYEILQDRANLKDAMLLNNENFVPRGWTALYDAIGNTINKFKKLRDEGKVDGVIFTILTDGEENRSTEFKLADIKSMIEIAEKEFGWQFVYLGANQDAFSVGATFGLAAAACATYDTNSDGLKFASAKMSADSTMYRSTYYDLKAEKFKNQDQAQTSSN